jgi:hypothetical protein
MVTKWSSEFLQNLTLPNQSINVLHFMYITVSVRTRQRPAILTEVFRSFPQSHQANAWIVL